MTSTPFDPVEKERQLRAESESWDTRVTEPAQPGDIPLIDMSGANDSDAAFKVVANQIGQASRLNGFYSLIGHGIPSSLMDATFKQARLFHNLPVEEKLAIAMDEPGAPVAGAGYLPVKHRKLPKRVHGNENEAFIVKSSPSISLADNVWPSRDRLPEFRSVTEAYADAIQALVQKLLPIYAHALNMPKDFFAEAFEQPLYRLRMTHYPPQQEQANDRFGIAPHVDTTFITLLAQGGPGLCVFNENRGCWVQVPMIEGALTINTGELLKQWSNDEFISVKHFANNSGDRNDSRYAIPFFLNANPDYVMECIPSCCGPANPAKYPPISYAQSQGVVQGE